jgi:hypothetical protein
LTKLPGSARNWIAVNAVQQTKGKLNMKTLNITFTTILLVLGWFSLSPAVKAADGPPIVGLWDVHYTSSITGPLFETYDQWHSDGLEFEVNSIAAGAMCQGTWKETAHRTVELFHVGFMFSPAGILVGPFRERQMIAVSLDRNSYDGTYDTRYYDTNGNLLFEDTGTMHATRFSVDSPLQSSQSNATAN